LWSNPEGAGNTGVPRPETELLLAIRKSDLPYKPMAEMLEVGFDRLEECHRRSALPNRADHEAAEALVPEAHREQIMSKE
jgi:hypothetical protein